MHYRNEGQYYPPLRFLNVFSTLAHRLYVCLGFMNKEEKEDLLKSLGDKSRKVIIGPALSKSIFHYLCKK